MKRSPFIHAAILGAYCMGFGVLLAATEYVAIEDIHQRATEDMSSSLTQVLPASLYDNDPAADQLTLPDAEGAPVTVYRATKSGTASAFAYRIAGTGYAGEIALMLGVDAEGRILGVRVLSHHETPGLGDKIEPAKSPWITRFTGLSLGDPPPERWKVKKDGGQFDQFSGATITPRGVVSAVRAGLIFFAAHKARLTEAK